jgi:hypothetical protein
MRNAWNAQCGGGHSTIVVRVSALVWVIDYFMTAGHTHASPSRTTPSRTLSQWLRPTDFGLRQPQHHALTTCVIPLEQAVDYTLSDQQLWAGATKRKYELKKVPRNAVCSALALAVHPDLAIHLSPDLPLLLVRLLQQFT